MSRILPTFLIALLLCACAAPAPGNGAAPVAAPATPVDPATPLAAADPAPQPSRDEPRPAPRKAPPPTGGPLPADVIPDKEIVPDRSCRADADCEVKNVGSCCGYHPACVNKDSPTDPAGVQARCARDGMMSTCGFPTIEACRCDAGQCKEQLQMIDGQVPQPAPVDR